MGARTVDQETIQRWIAEAVAANPGGGSSYLVWDAAYQNSAMSSPVGAYLYKDAGGNIWKVYEPTQNNTVSRSVYAYADSIDLFRFDNVENINNNLSDVKLVSLGSDFVFTDTVIHGIVIKAASTTGNFIINTQWFGGGYGATCPNDAEIYFTGNDSYLESVNVFGKYTFIDSLGIDCYVYAVNLISNAISIYFNDKTETTFSAALIWEDGSAVNFQFDTVNLFDLHMGGGSTLYVGGGSDQGNIRIGDSCAIGTASFMYNSINFLIVEGSTNVRPDDNNIATISNTHVGLDVKTIVTTGNIDHADYIRLGATSYIMGESGGTMTLTSF